MKTTETTDTTETATTPTAACPRAPGRPRSERANAAILAAALELLAERKHVAEVSVEAIAARAGVGKATIYRRWASKVDLFTDAVASLRTPLPAVAGVSVRDDLVDLLTVLCADLRNPLDRAVRLLMMSDTHPEIAERVHRDVFAPRGEAITAVIRRGIANGELRPDLDPTAALQLLIGGALAASRDNDEPTPSQAATLLVDTLWHGMVHPATTG